jgi:hypothetical protein
MRPAGPAQFRVSTLAGNVEAFQNGQWYVARAGHLLSSKDVVRTHDDSTRALLSRGSVEITLGDNMDLRVDKLERQDQTGPAARRTSFRQRGQRRESGD